MNKTRNRRKRRSYKAGLRHGQSARPKHKIIGGRTGQVFKKQRSRSKQAFAFVVAISAAVPRSIQQLLESWKS